MYFGASVCPFVCMSELSCLKSGHYQSEVFICVSVIKQRMRIHILFINGSEKIITLVRNLT